MSKIIQFGEKVEGYNIPVLNEREIRASAGILFVFVFVAILLAAMDNNFIPIKYFIIVFLLDMIIRVFINPKYSPTLILGRLIVRNQTPEYVGAPQKLFAWKIGLVLGSLMFILIVLMNTFSVITGLTCFICEIFLFFETSFGICLGCKFYGWYYKEKAQYCPGEVCDVTKKHDIQKTSKNQVFILLGLFAYIFLAIYLFNDTFSEPPSDLFEILSSSTSN